MQMTLNASQEVCWILNTSGNLFRLLHSLNTAQLQLYSIIFLQSTAKTKTESELASC